MKEVDDVWFINERTAGDWILFGFRFNNHVGIGTLTDAALSELFLKAGDGACEKVIKELLLRALRNYMRRHGNTAAPALGSPLDFS
ncbi:hypothetical protein AWB77_04420 [Caballeronia fortuita]|uniref:Uncharacterized protein n=1 Tax=Caballeronia fortuita TaxID=1777138 RepID=A0A158CQX8_9BURK|nr:hypothetical protein [Caballeronia fortuita]SAK84611.1 hypothetical protein AWB77_04420 [Caballeronia fortuita]